MTTSRSDVDDVHVDDTGDTARGRRLVIRCAQCGATLADHRWTDGTPAAAVMYRHGLGDGQAVKAHLMAGCGKPART